MLHNSFATFAGQGFRHPHKIITLALLTIAQASTAWAAEATNAAGPNVTAVHFDFDTPGQFTNNFNARPGANIYVSTAQVWGETNAGGVNNSGCLDNVRSSGDDQSFIYWRSGFDFSRQGQVLQAAIMFKFKTPANNQPVVQLGFVAHTNNVRPEAALMNVSSTNSPLNPNDGVSFMSFRVRTTAQPSTNVALEAQHKLSAGYTAQTGFTTATNGLPTNTWYRLSIAFTNTRDSANTLLGSAALQSMGLDGTTPGESVFVISPQVFTNASLVTNSALYLCVRAFENAGADLLDNLAAWGTDGPVVITGAPADQSVTEGRSARLAVALDGTPPYGFQWIKDGVDIAGAVQSICTIPRVSSSDAGQYSVRVTNSSGSTVSGPATLAVLADTEPPALLSAGSLDGNRIGIRFNELLDSATATNQNNYRLDTGGPVTQVTLRPDGQAVELFLANPAASNFTVTVTGVRDVAGNPLPTSATVNGTALGLTARDVGGPDGILPRTPGSTFTANAGDFDISAGGSDFWLTADDGHLVLAPRQGDFDVKVRLQRLSRNVLWSSVPSRDESAKAGLVARETTKANSRVIQAVAYPTDLGLPMGRNYWEYSTRPATGSTPIAIPGANNSQGNWTNAVPYPNAWIRLRRVNNTFTCYTSSNSVNWLQKAQMTDPYPETLQLGLAVTAHCDTNDYPVLAEFRELGEVAFPAASILSLAVVSPASISCPAFSNVTFRVAAAATGVSGSEVQYVWQRADGTGGFTNIPTASASSTNFTTAMFLPWDNTNLATFSWRCIIKVSGALSVTSTVATITNILDINGPILSSASVPTGSTNTILLSFSEPVEFSAATNPVNYTLTNSAGQMIPLTELRFISELPTNATFMAFAGATLTAGSYGLTAWNISDRAAPTPNTTASSTRLFNISGLPGLVLIERYLSLGTGNNPAVSTLTNHGRFLTNNYTDLLYSNVFGYNIGLSSSGQDDYGLRLASLFIPPSNGVYRFYLRSDDTAQFWMNTDGANSTDPSGKVLLAATASTTANYSTNGMATNVTLLGNQRYYIELLMKEGSGTDGCSLAFRAQGDTNLPPSTEVIGAPYLELPAGPVVVASVLPPSVMALEGERVTLSAVGITGAGPHFYRWFRSGVEIPNSAGQRSVTITMQPPWPCHDTAIFQMSNLWSVARITVPVEVTGETLKPTVLSARGDSTFRRILLSFSEAVTPATATNLSNYTLGGLDLLDATMSSTSTVLLTTTSQMPGATYPLGISGLTDTAYCLGANVIDPVVLPYQAWILAPGMVWREIYTNVSGGNISDLTNSPAWLSRTPGLIDTYNQAEVTGFGNSYGALMYGLFLPPITGSYTFFIQHDDGAAFYLGTNETPESAVLKINQGCCQSSFADGSRSTTNYLEAGKAYYFEGQLKQNSGSGYLRIGLRTPLDPPGSIPTNYLNGTLIAATGDPASPRLPTIVFTRQPTNAPPAVENQFVNFSVAATNSGRWYQDYQWQRYDNNTLSWVDIPGATSSNLSVQVTMADEGALFRASVILPGRITNSNPAAISVLGDTNRPTLVGAYGDLQPDKITLVFSEPLSAETATNIANYSISGGLAIRDAMLLPNGKAVMLTTAAAIPTGTYTASVSNILDRARYPNLLMPNPSTSASFTAPWLSSMGYVLMQVFYNIPNSNYMLNALTGNSKYPNSPDLAFYTNMTGWPGTSPNVDNYGTRMLGVIVPPVTGNYVFLVNADDAARMTLSPAGELSAGTVLINAEGSGCAACNKPASYSQPIYLTAGAPYAFEVLHYENNSSDFMQLFWQVPGTTYFTNILGVNLGLTVNPDSIRLAVTRQPTNATILEGRSAILNAGATASGGVPSFQWQRYSRSASDWIAIPNATNATLQAGPLCMEDDGALYRALAILSIANGASITTRTSQTATVTVQADEIPPLLMSAGSLDGNTIGVVFSEPVRADAPGFLNFDNWELLDSNILANLYYKNPDGSLMTNEFGDPIPTYYNYPVAEATLWPDPTAAASDKVLLKLSGAFTPNITGPFTIRCFYALDTACRENIGYGDLSSQVMELTALDIGNAQPPGRVFPAACNIFEVAAGGAGVGSKGDQFTYCYKQVDGDFDARLTVTSLPNSASTSSKAGLHLRRDVIASDGWVTNANIGAATNSMMASVWVTPTNGLNRFETALRYANSNNAVQIGGTPPVRSFPAQVRLVRERNTLTFLYLTNVVSGTNITSVWLTNAVTGTTNWPSSMFLGIGTSSSKQSNVVITGYKDFLLIDRPTIAEQPADITVQVGQTVVLRVIATGPGLDNPLRYQWRFNGADLAGATNATLTLTNVASEKSGSYSVEVRNSAGAVASGNALLTVNAPVRLTAIMAGAEILVLWPQQASGYELQSTSSLGLTPGLNWQTYTGPILSLNGNSGAVFPVSGTRFFRLHNTR